VQFGPDPDWISSLLAGAIKRITGKGNHSVSPVKLPHQTCTRMYPA
jgi:hypothetical protein